MTTLHHLALGARDVARVAKFYQDAFELECDRTHYDADGALRSIWLRAGSLLLMLEQTEYPPSRVEGVGSGPFLLAFRVAPDQRVKLELRLEQLGAPIESRTEYSSYARDPEGNRIAVSHFPLDRSP